MACAREVVQLTGQTVSETTSIVYFVILRADARKARVMERSARSALRAAGHKKCDEELPSGREKTGYTAVLYCYGYGAYL